MLRKFRVKNFLSFRDWQTLDLTVAANAPDLPGRFVQSIPGSKERFPTFVAIFGANASGKSNLLLALTYVASFICFSQDDPPDQEILLLPFLGNGWDKDTTEFEIEIDLPFNVSGSRHRFFYRLVISPDRSRILEEELKYYPHRKSRRLLFRRGQELQFGEDFEIGKNDPSIRKVRPNTSAISTLAYLNHPVSENLVHSLKSIDTNLSGVLKERENQKEKSALLYQIRPQMRKVLVDILENFDTGIEGVEFRSTENGRSPYFRHRNIAEEIPYEFESHGTKRIFSLFPILYDVLDLGGIAVIDELDNAIHSVLLPEIVDLFVDPVRNPNNAQLIAACQNPSILQHLEKEEVFFAEKGDDGATEIYGLKDIRGVRRESNIYANYLAGAFGGVPKVA
ncbi:MAG: AAA family ATPase [Rhodospirillaceae bacterium]|nr:AAA family ATPase [Rhodospirillaceae bacterium]MYH37722.1 AAA family ATPase [Rhodospirillaceae bacterium]